LEYLLDRDHRIGHAYFMSVNSLTELVRVFRVQIIPLLQEYFFDDMSRVATVLTTAPTAQAFVECERLSHGSLFSGARSEGLPPERTRYIVTPESLWTEESFQGLYQSTGGGEEVEESI
jgi:5-methylcytosine-specific restriction protein B